jgi:hypothetical protein
MRNTPITDELAREFAGKRLSSREAGSVWSLCRDLERELAEVTKQRDALAEALKKIYNVSVFDWDTMPEGSRRKYREVVLKMADGALSMKKGESDE